MPLHIVQLTIQSFKRLTAVEIEPDGSVVLVAGPNDAGKSAVLDAVECLLRGMRYVHGEPLHRGRASGFCEARVADEDGALAFVVRRDFQAGGRSTLTLTTAEGFESRAPQRRLDSILASLLDPSDFALAAKERQAEILRSLVGLDFSDLDEARERVYTTRRERSRVARAAQVRVDAFAPVPPDTPDEEVAVDDLLIEHRRLEERRTANEAKRRELAQAEHERDGARGQMETLAGQLRDAERALEKARAVVDTLRGEVAQLRDPDEADFARRYREVNTTNSHVRNKLARRAVERERDDAQKDVDELARALVRLNTRRAERIAAVTFPVEGLGFDGDGFVTYHGAPLEEASTAHKVRVGMGIALASKPELPVVVIRRGNDLDADSLGVVREMIERAGGVAFIERIQGGPGAVEIRDGRRVELTEAGEMTRAAARQGGGRDGSAG